MDLKIKIKDSVSKDPITSVISFPVTENQKKWVQDTRLEDKIKINEMLRDFLDQLATAIKKQQT